MMDLLRAAWLWLRIVGRMNQADYRTGPRLAWQVARHVHLCGDSCFGACFRAEEESRG